MSKMIETHRQAILTRYHGPTNYRGSRISADYAGGRVYVGYEHELNLAENHANAANVLVHKLEWNTDNGKWVGGTIPSGDMAWVNYTEGE